MWPHEGTLGRTANLLLDILTVLGTFDIILGTFDSEPIPLFWQQFLGQTITLFVPGGEPHAAHFAEVGGELFLNLEGRKEESCVLCKLDCVRMFEIKQRTTEALSPPLIQYHLK